MLVCKLIFKFLSEPFVDQNVLIVSGTTIVSALFCLLISFADSGRQPSNEKCSIGF